MGKALTVKFGVLIHATFKLPQFAGKSFMLPLIVLSTDNHLSGQHINCLLAQQSINQFQANVPFCTP